MKSGILFVLATLVLALTVSAADKDSPSVSVAVYDFTDADKNSGGYGGKVTALITASLTTESNLVMVERSDLKKALGEQAAGISGLVNSDTAAKIGQLTGAKVLVSGQVIKTGSGHLVIIANIVGTETGRLFAEKAEGTTENFADLASELSRKIAQNIQTHAASFNVEPLSHEACLARIVESVKGTNRPSVSVNFHIPKGPQHPSATVNSELGLILQKAGFEVVDGKSDHKPDVEISGVVDSNIGPRHGNLFTCRSVIEAKVQERRTGKIIAINRAVADAVDVGKMTANRNAQAKAADGLAEKILPLLAQ